MQDLQDENLSVHRVEEESIYMVHSRYGTNHVVLTDRTLPIPPAQAYLRESGCRTPRIHGLLDVQTLIE